MRDDAAVVSGNISLLAIAFGAAAATFDFAPLRCAAGGMEWTAFDLDIAIGFLGQGSYRDNYLFSVKCYRRVYWSSW